MNKRSLLVYLSAIVVSAALIATAEDSESSTPTGEAFYTRPALFSTRPSSIKTIAQYVNRFGPVGIGIELHPPAFVMKVKNVEEGSPAAATGAISAGQIIESINGEKLKDIDPRIQLGNIITKAEARDGKIVFVLKDGEDGAPRRVTVTIPRLGAYSSTWPVKCPKSDKIIRGLAEHVSKGKPRFASQEMLFLLSTGEEKDLDVVKGWAKDGMDNFKPHPPSRGIYQWHVGWADSSVAEYYLRTGDKSVLPYIKDHADAVRRTMYHDGWGGRGVPGHHMGIAGTSTLRFLLLARQCGVDVEERMLQVALKHYSRYAGKGVNPYPESHPEVTFTDNGRNGKLAFAMMAAAALLPEDKNDWYEKAAEVAAMHSFYSTSYMLHGHTGGGIGEVWRSAAMGLMRDKKPKQYRDFMDSRTWFYDLSRRFNGAFGIAGGSESAGKGYDSEPWGITMGLTYTGPRRKLVMFGAPRGKYAQYHEIPERAWGTSGDDDFLDIAAAADPSGSVKNLDGETVAEDTGLHFHRKMGAGDISDETLVEYAHHPQHMYRAYVAGKIYSGKRLHLIPQLLKSKDARVRYVGVTAMPHPRVSARPEKCDPGFPMDAVTDEVRDRLYEMLEDPHESWFVVDHILGLISRRDAEELAPHIDRIIYFLGHDEPWLRHAALKAIVPLALHKDSYRKAQAAMVKHVPNFLRRPGSLQEFAEGLGEADVDVQKAGLESLGRIYGAYPGTNTDPPGGKHPSSDTWYLDSVAAAISAAPGGMEKLYEVSQARYPEASLMHRGSFLGGSLDEYSAGIKKAITRTILEELIPEYVGKNWKKLQADAKGEKVQDAVSTLGGNGWRGGLTELYSKAGITDYDWREFGPDRTEIEWDYFSFDPPETQKWEAPEARYRDVTMPAGMEEWFAADFDPKKAGWKRGRAPFVYKDGKMESLGDCTVSFCRCGDEPGTFWEKEALFVRGKIRVPEIKEGHRYRLLLGGRSHVGSGEGYAIYVNGEKLFEEKSGTGKRAGGTPKGYLLPADMMEEIGGQEILVAVKTFWRKHPRSGEKCGFFTLFMEEMTIPPLGNDLLYKSARVIPFTCAQWQELQNPESEVDPDEGKFRFDGDYKPNDKILGSWRVTGYVTDIDEPVDSFTALGGRFRPLFTSIAFKDDGSTDNSTMIWSGDKLMDLDRYQALQMTVKKVGDDELLFVENGGFDKGNGDEWKPPVLVLARN